LIVVILAVMWIAVLVPPLLRSRTDGRPSSSIAGFRRQLSTLQSSAPSRSYGNARPATAYKSAVTSMRPARVSQQREMLKRRRQNILVGLGGLFLASAAIGFAKDIPLAKTISLITGMLLAGYVYLLVQIRKNAQARAMRYEWSRAA
jgi:hypothetical protein